MPLKLYCLFPVLFAAIDVYAALSLNLPLKLPLNIIPSFIAPKALDELRSSNKLSEFIKHLGIPNEGLCHPDTDENVDPMFNEELDFGDLLMKKESKDKNDEEEIEDDATSDVQNQFGNRMSHRRRKHKKQRAKKPKKWVNGIVPYYVSKDFNYKQKRKIEDAIKDMNSNLENVHFRPVKRSDRNYVIIFSGKGCYSSLGMTGGQQALSLQADKCLVKGTIQHELLHVLGFRHEQNRPDRNIYVKVLYENIPENWYKDYKRYSPSEANFIGIYDYYSVLHYPPQAPNSRGRKLALKILDDNVDLQKIGERKEISKMDLLKADELYSDDSEEDKS